MGELAFGVLGPGDGLGQASTEPASSSLPASRCDRNESTCPVNLGETLAPVGDRPQLGRAACCIFLVVGVLGLVATAAGFGQGCLARRT